MMLMITYPKRAESRPTADESMSFLPPSRAFSEPPAKISFAPPMTKPMTEMMNTKANKIVMMVILASKAEDAAAVGRLTEVFGLAGSSTNSAWAMPSRTPWSMKKKEEK